MACISLLTVCPQMPQHSSLSISRSVVSDSLQPYGLWPARLLCPWNSPGKNTGVGCQSLLQGIFPTQGSNPAFPHSLGCKNLKENIFQPSLEVAKSPMQQSWLRNNVPRGMVTSRNRETQVLMGENDASVHTAHAGLREAQAGRSGRWEQA